MPNGLPDQKSSANPLPDPISAELRALKRRWTWLAIVGSIVTVVFAGLFVVFSQSMDNAFHYISVNETKIDRLLQSLGDGRVLAMARVTDGKLVWRSDGVSFDRNSGKVSFPNPQHLMYVPVISNSSTGSHITETHFISALGNDYFTVWSHPMDAGNSNGPPRDFTAVVIGFEGTFSFEETFSLPGR